jgi:hypothetical protein
MVFTSLFRYHSKHPPPNTSYVTTPFVFLLPWYCWNSADINEKKIGWHIHSFLIWEQVRQFIKDVPPELLEQEWATFDLYSVRKRSSSLNSTDFHKFAEERGWKMLQMKRNCLWVLSFSGSSSRVLNHQIPMSSEPSGVLTKLAIKKRWTDWARDNSL